MFKLLRSTAAAILLTAMLPLNTALSFDKPVMLAEQGSFLAGGKAGNSTVPENITATPWDQLWFSNFHLGSWPNFFPRMQVSNWRVRLIMARQ